MLADERPIPAPRISLLGRKPPVPKRENVPKNVTPLKQSGRSKVREYDNVSQETSMCDDGTKRKSSSEVLPKISTEIRNFASKMTTGLKTKSWPALSQVLSPKRQSRKSHSISTINLTNSTWMSEKSRRKVIDTPDDSLTRSANRTSTISINSVGGFSLMSGSTRFVSNHEQMSITESENDWSANNDLCNSSSSFTNLIGPNGGISNPGYIGLDEYRRLMTLSSNEGLGDCNSEQPKSDSSWGIEVDKILETADAVGDISLAGWAAITVCKKDRGKIWISLDNGRLTGWHNQDKCFLPKNDLVSYCLKTLNAAGSVWIRQGSACAWSRGWMFLSEYKLCYILENCSVLFELDIRKFIGLKSNISKVDWCASLAGSIRGPFLLLQEGSSLFLQAENDALTSAWIEMLKSHMKFAGNRLEDCKLTIDDVPVIVDKCIKFISTYGLLHPGLYRRNGSAIESRLLLADFKKDPNNVHLMAGSDDMISVVADVLRSFFRQLDSPLVPYFVQERLFVVAELNDSGKYDEYHEILNNLPRIRLQTLRRVLDHLKDVTEHSQSNLATIENIAKVFGPTLFSVDNDNRTNSTNSDFAYTIQQVNLLKDLLLHYAIIFRISIREMTIKNKMSILQEKPNQTKARADGFLIPIHIMEKDNHTFNVQSSSTAEQVCEAARNRPVIRSDSTTTDFALFEEIKCGQLERRVNPMEKMSSMVTGRWLDWEPVECYLVFKRDKVPFSFNHLYPFADDVKISEPGAKSFSTGHLKLEGGLVVHYNKALKKQNEWPTDDILWYLGCETHRKPPYPHTLTFIIPKNNFKYKTKYMGYCAAFRENSFRTQWLNAVISSQQNFSVVSKMPLIEI